MFAGLGIGHLGFAKARAAAKPRAAFTNPKSQVPASTIKHLGWQANKTHRWPALTTPQSQPSKHPTDRETAIHRRLALGVEFADAVVAANGDLRARSNMGKGQIRAADYVMTPNRISQNHNAGGSAIAGMLGGLVGGNAGNLVGGLNLSKLTADVVLTITDVRSSEQVAMAEGNAKKTDLGWGARGNVFSGGDYGEAGAGGYANTEIGQVITLAYLQAYTDIVSQLGGLSGNAAASNTQQAVTVTRAGRLFGNAKGTGVAVRTLEPGMMLYPTGTKEGIMWEVEDEMGNRGWVSSAMLELSK
ncbi:CsgG/HfaB family protein [Xanthomonas oryzae]|uniref:CsgG/HfaB family protein n=1 Tax=Xanthomonas oryzae TaxID=347 RepID=UPI0037048BF7